MSLYGQSEWLQEELLDLVQSSEYFGAQNLEDDEKATFDRQWSEFLQHTFSYKYSGSGLRVFLRSESAVKVNGSSMKFSRGILSNSMTELLGPNWHGPNMSNLVVQPAYCICPVPGEDANTRSTVKFTIGPLIEWERGVKCLFPIRISDSPLDSATYDRAYLL